MSNRELTPSNVSFPDSPLGDGGTDVMDNRTALYMPQKTLNYEISKSLLRYICEAGELNDMEKPTIIKKFVIIHTFGTYY